MLSLIFLFTSSLLASDISDVELIVNGRVIDNVERCSLRTSKQPLFYGVFDRKDKWGSVTMHSTAGDAARPMGKLAAGTLVEVKSSSSIRSGSLARMGAEAHVAVNVLQHALGKKEIKNQLAGPTRGYVQKKFLTDPSRVALEIHSSLLVGDIEAGDMRFLNGKVLRAKTIDDAFSYVDCCHGRSCQKYPVFSVYKEQEPDVSTAFVAFSPNDMTFIHRVSISLEKPKIGESRASSVDGSQGSRALVIQQKRASTTAKPDDSATRPIASVTAVDRSSRPPERPSRLAPWRSPRSPVRPKGPAQDPESAGQSFLASLFFPVKGMPIRNFTQGMRRFGARRSGGQRKHAGCDLYRPKNEEVLAVKSGTVLRRYHFYLGTYAVEVKNNDGTIIRYGELSGRKAKRAKRGQKIRAGDVVGYIGRMRGIKRTMLHFEEYKGTRKGPLTQTQNPPFKRRKDLKDPTPLLVSLAQSKGILR